MRNFFNVVNHIIGFGGLILVLYLGLNLLFFRDYESIVMGFMCLVIEVGIILYSIREGFRFVGDHPGVKPDRLQLLEYWGNTKVFVLRIISPSIGIVVSLYAMRFEELFLVGVLYLIASLMAVPLLYIEDIFS